MAEQNYIRKDTAIVNNDFASYQAAKLRRNKENRVSCLEERINKLEACLKRLEQTIEEMIK